MPRIQLQDPFGMNFIIHTRNETTLKAWFDEVLPWIFMTGRPGIDNFNIIWPTILIHPMWDWDNGLSNDPDWFTDTRVISRVYHFQARNGEEGIRELDKLRQTLQRELDNLKD